MSSWPIVRLPVLRITIGAALLLAGAACGRRQVPEPVAEPPFACELVQGPEEYADTVRVALFGAVDPEHAPWARNAGEQLLFHHLYETLITIDCLGEVRAGLAGSWHSGDGGRRWTFEMREGAKFWNGSPVTARDVARRWRHPAVEPMVYGAGIDSITVADDRVLHLYFARSRRDVPRALSAPAFAVAKPSGESHWPLGSGPYQFVTAERGSAGMHGGTITVKPAFGMDGPVVQFLETSVGDARDLLERVIDVMVTADPVVIEYAAGRPERNTVSLPWSRTYVLLSTSRAAELQWSSEPGTISTDLSDRLARDAVRGDARGYRPPSWWDDLEGCGDLSADVPWLPPMPRGADSSHGVRRILYTADDEVGRALAERIVALASADPVASAGAAALSSAVPGLIGNTPGIIAEGVTGSELRASLRHGDDFAYVVAVPRLSPDPCSEARTLINRAQWLSILEHDLADALVPLVDTRSQVIVTGGKVGLIVDWYGNMLIVNEMLQGR